IIDLILEEPGLGKALSKPCHRFFDPLSVRRTQQGSERRSQWRSDILKKCVIARTRDGELIESESDTAHNAGLRIGERSVQVEQQNSHFKSHSLQQKVTLTSEFTAHK